MKVLDIIAKYCDAEDRAEAIEALESLEKRGYIMRLSDDWSAVWAVGGKAVSGAGSAVGQIG